MAATTATASMRSTLPAVERARTARAASAAPTAPPAGKEARSKRARRSCARVARQSVSDDEAAAPMAVTRPVTPRKRRQATTMRVAGRISAEKPSTP